MNGRPFNEATAMSKKKTDVSQSAATQWPNVKKLVDDGATLEIHGGGYHLDIASLQEGEQLVCMFTCNCMKFDEIMDRLDELAKRYNKEGIVSDKVNGSEYCVW